MLKSSRLRWAIRPTPGPSVNRHWPLSALYGSMAANSNQEKKVMIDLHYWPTPNGKKVTILLEEAAIPYNIIKCNIGKGDQFTPEFLKMTPTRRMPTMVDTTPPGGGEPIAIFESGAIMMYLAEKVGKFYPQDLRG